MAKKIAGKDFMVVRTLVRPGQTVWLALKAGKIVAESLSTRKNEAVRVARTLAKKAKVSYWVKDGRKLDQGK